MLDSLEGARAHSGRDGFDVGEQTVLVGACDGVVDDAVDIRIENFSIPIGGKLLRLVLLALF